MVGIDWPYAKLNCLIMSMGGGDSCVCKWSDKTAISNEKNMIESARFHVENDLFFPPRTARRKSLQIALDTEGAKGRISS